MSFDDIARRMKQERSGRNEALHTLWHGEEPELPPLAPPVPAEGRTRATVAAYAVLLAGLAVAGAAGVCLLLWFSSFDTWERRGMYAVIAAGAGIVVKATMMFDAIPD